MNTESQISQLLCTETVLMDMLKISRWLQARNHFVSKTGFHFLFLSFVFIPLFLKDPFHDSLHQRCTLQLLWGREGLFSAKVLTTTFVMVRYGQSCRYGSGSLLQRELHWGAGNSVHRLFLQLCRELVCPGEEQRVKNHIILEKVRLEGASGNYLVWLSLESRASDWILQLAKHRGSHPLHPLPFSNVYFDLGAPKLDQAHELWRRVQKSHPLLCRLCPHQSSPGEGLLLLLQGHTANSDLGSCISAAQKWFGRLISGTGT